MICSESFIKWMQVVLISLRINKHYRPLSDCAEFGTLPAYCFRHNVDEQCRSPQPLQFGNNKQFYSDWKSLEYLVERGIALDVDLWSHGRQHDSIFLCVWTGKKIIPILDKNLEKNFLKQPSRQIICEIMPKISMHLLHF